MRTASARHVAAEQDVHRLTQALSVAEVDRLRAEARLAESRAVALVADEATAVTPAPAGDGALRTDSLPKLTPQQLMEQISDVAFNEADAVALSCVPMMQRFLDEAKRKAAADPAFGQRLADQCQAQNSIVAASDPAGTTTDGPAPQ